LFSPSLLVWSLVQGGLALGLVAAIYLAASLHGLPAPEVRALSFVSLVLANFALILVNRSFSDAFHAIWRWDNRALWVVTLVTAMLLGTALAFEPARQLFRFGPLHPEDLALSFVGAAGLVALLEYLKRYWKARLTA
jgi:Ca2+-transporting ATPase